jgi:hypothetical protein
VPLTKSGRRIELRLKGKSTDETARFDLARMVSCALMFSSQARQLEEKWALYTGLSDQYPTSEHELDGDFLRGAASLFAGAFLAIQDGFSDALEHTLGINSRPPGHKIRSNWKFQRFIIVSGRARRTSSHTIRLCRIS